MFDLFLELLYLLLFFLTLRWSFLYKSKICCRRSDIGNRTVRKVNATAIIIGSGGHTTEMLRIIQKLDVKHFSPRVYIMSASDTTSEAKIHAAEKSNKDYEIAKIPRSRNVNQSYTTSVFTTLYALMKSVPLMLKLRPHLILCNGPGTCVPICFLGFVTHFLWLSETTIIFVESICRVKTLSLTGKIMLYFADQVIVQWPQLQDNYKNTNYIGRLV